MFKIEITAALIAGIVSLIVCLATYKGVLKNVRELQFQEIIKARIKAYSELWRILIKYGNINYYHRLKYNQNWVIEFHNELDNCNMKYGVLFYTDVHEYFERLRGGLQTIRFELERNSEYIMTEKFQSDCENLYSIIDDKKNNRKGLGGLLKKGLGSFQKPVIDKNK